MPYNDHDPRTWPDVKLKAELRRSREDVKIYQKILDERNHMTEPQTQDQQSVWLVQTELGDSYAWETSSVWKTKEDAKKAVAQSWPSAKLVNETDFSVSYTNLHGPAVSITMFHVGEPKQ